MTLMELKLTKNETQVLLQEGSVVHAEPENQNYYIFLYKKESEVNVL